MSVPNTGYFEIELEDGTRAIYDGVQWCSTNEELLEKLRVWRPYVGGKHADVKDLALKYLKYARIANYKVIRIEYDEWEHDLPEGWID